MKLQLYSASKSTGSHVGFASCVCWASNDLVLTTADDRRLLFWSAANYHEPVKALQLPLPKNAYPTSMHLLPITGGSGGISNFETSSSASSSASSTSSSSFKIDGNSVIAIGSSIGHLHLLPLSWNGASSRGDRGSIEAHSGAIIVLRWSNDASTLATGGEDGLIKIWSRAGMLRSTINTSSAGTAQTVTSSVYALSWSPDSNSLVYGVGGTSGRLVVKSLSPQSRSTEWTAHEGLVVCLAWSQLNGHILSAAEDGHVRMWDNSGRLLYSSPAATNSAPLATVAWSPDGELFSVGGFSSLKLHDAASGCCLSVEKLLGGEGVVYSVAWSPDSNQLAAVCSGGQVLFAYVIERTLEGGGGGGGVGSAWTVTTTSRRTIRVANATVADVSEVLEFSEAVTRLSFAYGHLVVVAGSQCFVYQAVQPEPGASAGTGNNTSTASSAAVSAAAGWSTPTHFDVKNMEVLLVRQAAKHFLLVTAAAGSLYGYDGRFLRSIKLSNLRLEAIRPSLISLNNSTLAYKDGINQQVVHFFELDGANKMAGVVSNTGSGKSGAVGSNSYRHNLEVVAVKMSPEAGAGREQICALLDRNADLYIVSLAGGRGTAVSNSVNNNSLQAFKLTSSIVDLAWHSDFNVLTSLHDQSGQLTLWLCPNVAYIDASLLPDVVLSLSAGNPGGGGPSSRSTHSRIVDFSANQLTVQQRVDGVRYYIPLNPFVLLLHRLKLAGRWTEAVKMCNFLDKSVAAEVQQQLVSSSSMVSASSTTTTTSTVDRAVCTALWATLAAMALEAKQFEVAEIAYAAINKLDKVLLLGRIKALPVAEAAAAELELMCGNISGAETIFLQRGYLLRAVMLNLELYRWRRALEVAQQFRGKFSGLRVTVAKKKSTEEDGQEDVGDDGIGGDGTVTLLQLVLACRQNYLKNRQKMEKMPQFQTLFNEVDHLVEWADVERTLRSDEKLVYTKSV